MTKFKAANFAESFGYAWRGLKLAFNSQRNFVIEVIIAFFVILASVLLRFDFSDIAILVIMCAIVLICEMFNSVIEFSLDAVFKNEYSKLVEMAKDMAAGMVLLASITSIVVGVIIFVSNLVWFPVFGSRHCERSEAISGKDHYENI